MSKPLRYRRTGSDKVSVADDKNELARLSAAGVRLLGESKAAEAVPYFEQANAINPRDFDLALNLSAAYILAGRFKLARTLLKKLTRRYPDRPQVWINLGAAYLGNPVLATSDEQMQAIEAFNQALLLDPTAISVAYNIGLVYRDRQEYEQAAHWFQQAVEHDPDDQDARRQLQRILERESDQ